MSDARLAPPSMTSVLRFMRARYIAAVMPPGPPPTTTQSNGDPDMPCPSTSMPAMHSPDTVFSLSLPGNRENSPVTVRVPAPPGRAPGRPAGPLPATAVEGRPCGASLPSRMFQTAANCTANKMPCGDLNASQHEYRIHFAHGK